MSEKFRKYDRPAFPHRCIKEKPCLSIDLEVQEIERSFRCLAIENIIERLVCFPSDIIEMNFILRTLSKFKFRQVKKPLAE